VNPARVAVVGGGPAGLMAAETLVDAGIQVTVYDQARSFGRKFLLAGRGGLNITHSEPLDAFIGRYGPEAPLLERALRAFSPADLMSWCAGHGEETFVGTSGRVFPRSIRATPLLRSWLQRLAASGVAMKTQHRWSGWNSDGELIFEVADRSHVHVGADATIFALGGASWPRVGSNGGWAQHFVAAGIEVADFTATNCAAGVDWSTVMLERFEGEPIKNAIFSVGSEAVRGDAVVTSFGLEGGPIYAHSRALRELITAGAAAVVEIDTHPDLTAEGLITRLNKRRPGATTSRWLSAAKVAPITVSLLREATDNNIPADPAVVASLLKALPIEVTKLAPLDRAISSAGGIVFAELDDSLMVRSMPGVFVAGEMSDWEAPTGGYLLQACMSTGVAAAKGVVNWLGAQR